MDYHSMKRRELQALCKEHCIPANSANSVLADRLSELLNVKQKPTARQRTCMKSMIETTDESEPVVSRRQAKKVRFSPNNDLVEYELRSGKKDKDMVIETKHRRKSVAKKVAKPVVDNINTVELIDDGVQIPVRLTRSRVQGKDDAILFNEKKQGRRAVKDVKNETDEGSLGKVTRSKVHRKVGGVQVDEIKQNKRATKDVEKVVESITANVVGRVRVTRSKARTMMEDGMGPNLNPQVKKKSGKRVVNDVENVKISKEIMDVPVRVTRSRGQTSTDNVANMVSITQAEKERTRRETKVSDMSNNLSNVASENNRELPRRISPRMRGVEIAIEDGSEKLGIGKRKKRSEESTAEVSESHHHADKGLRQSRRNKAKVEDSTVLNLNISKAEMVDDKKITRSKALLATKSSKGNNRNKGENKVEVQRESNMVQQLEEPLDHAGMKNMNRRKSVMQLENTEIVPHLEDHLNSAARKNTRLMQKAKEMGIDKPLVGKRKMEKEIEMAESPNVRTRKTVGKGQSKEQSGNLSMLDEGLKDEKNVTGTGKDASENEMKTVASVTVSHKSKKRRGNPITEDQTIETVYVSSVDESPRRATRSASKSEGKAVSYSRQNFVAKKQESSVKTPASRLDNRAAIESAFLEEHQSASRTVASGTINKDNTSKRRAKLSGSKPSGSEEHVEKFNTEGESVSKLENFKLEEETKIGRTPAIEESDRRLTRSAIRREKNDAANTTPGRFTRSGIKHRGNAESKLFETVDKKKQQRQSAHQRQPLADAPFSPEVTGVGAHPDVTSSRVIKKSNSRKKKKSPLTVQKTVHADAIGVSSEISKETDDQILEHSVDIFVSESMRLPTEVMEENTASMSEPAIVMEKESLVPTQNASGPESHAISDEPNDTARAGEVMEVAVADIEKSSKNETSATPNLTENLLSGKQQSSVDLPNFEDETPSRKIFSDIKRTPFSMAEVAETMPDVQNQNQEVDVKSASFSEAQVQVAVHSEKSVVKSARPEAYGVEMGSTGSGSMSKMLQTDVMVEEPVVSPGVTIKGNNGNADNNCDSISYEDGPSDVCHLSFEQSYDKSKLKEMEAVLEPSIIEGYELMGKSKEMEALLEPSIIEGNDGGYDQIKKESEQDTLTCNDSLENPSVDKHVVAHKGAHDDDDERTSAQKPLMDAPDFEDNGVHGSIDILQNPEMGSRGVAGGMDYVCQTLLEEEHDVEAHEDDPLEQSIGDDTLQGLAGYENYMKDDMVATQDSLAEQHEPSTGKNTTYVTGDEVDNKKELESEVVTSTGYDAFNIPILGKSDGEDDTVNAIKGCETDLMPSTASKDDVKDDHTNDPKENERGLEPSNTMDEQDVGGDEPELAHNENIPMGCEEAEPVLNVSVDEFPSDLSTIKETPQTAATSGNDITGKRVDAMEDKIVDSNKDAVSNILGDVDGLENAIGVVDTKNDITVCGSEQKSKKSATVSPGMSNEQRIEEDETTENGHALDGDKFVEDSSNHIVDEENIRTPENRTREETSPAPMVYTKEKPTVADSGSDPFIEDIGVHESPITDESLPFTYEKESPVYDTVADPPTSFKDEDRNKQDSFISNEVNTFTEEIQQASTSIDLENHSSGIDEYLKPVLANESDDLLATTMKDDQVSDLQVSARASSFLEVSSSSSPAADLVTSVTNLEKSSRNVADGKFNQDEHMLKANADVTEEFFNWSDSSLKALLTTPTTNRTNNVKRIREGDAVSFSFPDGRRGDDIGISGSVAHDIDRQWESEPFDDKTQGTATQSPENEMYGVSNFEEFSHKYFGDEVDGSSDMSMEKKKHFEFGNDLRQDDLSTEAAGTSYQDPSGLNSNSIQKKKPN